MTPSRILAFSPVVASVLIGLLGLGCDQVSPREMGQPPSVYGLQVTPDSVNAADLPAGQVDDSLAAVELEISTTVRDEDGRVERTVFTIEPASSPQGTATGRLRARDSTTYARQFAIRVPAFVDEVYTVRVFAVDDDSLASNQAIGRFRFVPDS